MGTRHLIAVVKDGEPKIAQYGQWDGYPDGQGENIVEFLMKHYDKDKFSSALNSVEWINEGEVESFLKELGAPDGWLNGEQKKKFHERFPGLSRDHGAEILELIQEGKVNKIRNSWSFAADSLFCEWAYVLDLDSETLEVYRGFQKSPPPDEERFAKLPVEKESRDTQYYPVKLIKKVPFSMLTTSTMATLINELNEDCEE